MATAPPWRMPHGLRSRSASSSRVTGPDAGLDAEELLGRQGVRVERAPSAMTTGRSNVEVHVAGVEHRAGHGGGGHRPVAGPFVHHVERRPPPRCVPDAAPCRGGGAGPRWESWATVAIMQVVTIHSGSTDRPQRKPPSESMLVSRAPVRRPPPAPRWWSSTGARPPISEEALRRRRGRDLPALQPEVVADVRGGGRRPVSVGALTHRPPPDRRRSTTAVPGR